MDRISYSIKSLGLINAFSSLECQNSPFEKQNFFVGEDCIGGTDNYSGVLNKLVNENLLAEENDEKESERRAALLKLISKYTMVDVTLNHRDIMFPNLYCNSNTPMIFKTNHDGEIEILYEVPYDEGINNSFTLSCQFFLGKDFQLDEKKSRVYFKFNSQHSDELKNSLDFRNLKTKILDWLKELFFPASYAVDNTAPSMDMTDYQLSYLILKRESELEQEWDDYTECTELTDNDKKLDCLHELIKDNFWDVI
ncbi:MULTISPECIES: hypothetical protein [Yersinia]|uniref:hypothetical protein n=1 Tax=Yersinia TaxID=629 RepID=UPI0011AB0D77|nr:MULTISPECIES: hypothetical protein [Yersinia]